MCCTTHWLKCLHERFTSSAWSSTWCGCPFFDSLFLAMFLSVCLSYPFFFYLNSDLYLFLHVVDIRAISHSHSANLRVWPLAENTPLTGYEPKLPDDFHYSETTEIFFRDASSDTVPSFLFDAELRDCRQSAPFTAVRSGARRTSGPKTSLSVF